VVGHVGLEPHSYALPWISLRCTDACRKEVSNPASPPSPRPRLETKRPSPPPDRARRDSWRDLSISGILVPRAGGRTRTRLYGQRFWTSLSSEPLVADRG
jgi:hypothetical protein